MALIQTAWLVGSEPNVPETTIEVTANGTTEDLTLPGNDYYTWDGAASHSALTTLGTVLTTHSEIGSCTALIGRDRRVRLTCDVAFSIDSWTDLTFRDLLGFAGTEAFTSVTQTAGLSDYLWSPGRCEIPDAPLGSQGLPYHDTAVGMSGDAVVTATTNNSGRKNRFLFRYVEAARVMSANSTPGDYERFWDRVVLRYFRFKLYREIVEENTGTDATDANLLGEVLGPYKLLRSDGVLSMPYQREIDRVELFSSVELPCLLVGDY